MLECGGDLHPSGLAALLSSGPLQWQNHHSQPGEVYVYKLTNGVFVCVCLCAFACAHMSVCVCVCV